MVGYKYYCSPFGYILSTLYTSPGKQQKKYSERKMDNMIKQSADIPEDYKANYTSSLRDKQTCIKERVF
jgi:hypothetical protein